MAADLEGLQAALGYRFRDPQCLVRALTHKSRAFEKKLLDALADDNERLEFLGDSILGFLISEWLVSRFPDYPEGRLSKLRARLVSASHLHSVAQRLELGRYLQLGRGEEMSGGREKKALLSDAVEAIIASLYLDAGMDEARRFVLAQIVAGSDLAEGDDEETTDYKSSLQERAQALRLPQPRYLIVAENGPEHAKTFVVEARLGGMWSGRGEGRSKKSAGQEAARVLMDQLPAFD